MIINKKLYEEVFKTVVDAFEFEQIFMDNKTIDRRITDWYNHTDYTDVETLAALVMGSEYKASITCDEVEEMKEFFFPSNPHHFELSIAEIEMSLHDYDFLFE